MAKSNKNAKAVKKPEFFLIRWFKSVSNFFRGVSVELKKVTWPTKDELIQYTIVVVVICAVLTLFIWGLDTVLGLLKGLF
ncbi:preprotein translocase subunit SecE [Anaerofustis stercorihominis]|uniref:Protein translocase subunit SecE n=1 Tax=Anaerofustis stercorihominis TaxID=214853 RepID=A0A3E3DWT2_9FIRM|nr:preprotein translocase subunit SecE [Anaerofustis stercorihominis]RGD73720.1 preprotein translocase subunit SecE [Anaerofustis stercorihominis]